LPTEARVVLYSALGLPMRILLVDINPFKAPVTPISLGNLGAVLKAKGHEVRVVSLGSTSRFSPKGFTRFLKDYSPGLVGFGTYQRNIFHVRAMAGIVKSVLPNARVAMGGPQATFLPDAALDALPEVDFVSRGEGELAIQAIVDAVTGGGGDEPVPGVTTRTSHGEIVTGSAPEPPDDLDGYPSPWRLGVLDPGAMDESIMLTSRGCLNNCTFCTTPAAFGRHIRSQSVERVLDDIAVVARAGTGRLWFADPNFSYSETRVVDILEGVIRRKLHVSMWIETRADMVTPELLALMQRAGVHTVALGLESASPSVAPKLNKGVMPEEIGAAARSALAAGMDVELFSQYALPGETLHDALQTLAFVKETGVAIRGNSNAQQMQIYFGSAVCKNPARHGVRPLRDDLPPYLAIGTEFETEWMTKVEIEHIKSAWLAESIDGGKRVVS